MAGEHKNFLDFGDPAKEAGWEPSSWVIKEFQGQFKSGRTYALTAGGRYPSEYRVSITKINEDGSFEGKVHDVVPYL